MNERREVIVIGGGMAGLTAALSAAEAGGDVLVLESEPSVGGSMALSGGLIWAPATFELARRWIPRGDPELQRILVDELADAWSWFEAHGLPLDPPVACLKDRMGRGQLMAVGGPGAREPWAQALLDATRRQGAEVLLEARVEAVEPDADGWAVTWTRAGSRSRASARTVVFCGGGFQNSEDLVRRYVSPWPEDMVVRSNRSSDGVALRSLIPLGAPVSHGMHSFYGHTLPYIEGKAWDSGLEFLAGSLYFSDFCLIVNQLGLRFTDESVGCIDEHNAERGCQQPHGRYYVVFDERIRRERIDVDLMGIPGIEATRVPEKLVQLEELGASIVTAETPPSWPLPWRRSSAFRQRTSPTPFAPSTPRPTRSVSSTRRGAATTRRSQRRRCARPPASRASPTPWEGSRSTRTCASPETGSTASSPPEPTPATSSRTSTEAGWAGPPCPAAGPDAPRSRVRRPARRSRSERRHRRLGCYAECSWARPARSRAPRPHGPARARLPAQPVRAPPPRA
jgi:hypothetical protein